MLAMASFNCMDKIVRSSKTVIAKCLEGNLGYASYCQDWFIACVFWQIWASYGANSIYIMHMLLIVSILSRMFAPIPYIAVY